MLRGIASCIMELHQSGYVHRNIRPDTLIFFEDTGSWKFSCCTMAVQTNEVVEPGIPSVGYAAPEVVIANASRSPMVANTAVDAWSFGVIACSILCTGDPASMILTEPGQVRPICGARLAVLQSDSIHVNISARRLLADFSC